MGPTQWHGRTRWQAVPHTSLRQIGGVPQLLADHAACIGEFFHRRNERHWITSGREFVVAALARQDRPRTTDTGLIEGAAVILLPIAVMIVPPPAWPLRQVVLEHAINDFE